MLLLQGVATQAQQYATAEVMAVGGSTVVGATVVPYKEVVLTALVPGQVRFMAGREGDRFNANQMLVQIDDADLQARRRAAVADIMAREAALAQAQTQYSRELVSPQINRSVNQPTGFGLPSMFDAFMTRPMANMTGLGNTWVERYSDLQGQASSLSQANSALLAARAGLEGIDAKLRDTRLYAPFEGVIIGKMAEVGDTVQPGQPLIKFAYVNYLRLQAEVPVRLVSSLAEGMFVPARLDVGEGVVVNARVSQIYPVADQSRHTVTVKFDLPQGVPGGPGMYSEIRLPDAGTEGRQMPTVPKAALVQRGSLFGVYVMEDGKPSLRLVRVGGPAGNDRVTILSGLAGGEQVVVNPPQDRSPEGARGSGG
ncbi:MAG: efflux RND transporter periplasmic adaptor subunit [Hyphomicrobiales bacterium]